MRLAHDMSLSRGSGRSDGPDDPHEAPVSPDSPGSADRLEAERPVQPLGHHRAGQVVELRDVNL